MGSKRTIITLPEEDKRWLESYGKAHGVSVSEAIRQSIKKLKENQADETYSLMIIKTKGLWKRGDGLEYQKSVRAEWDR